jgi:predicted nucleotidyltransferase
MMRGRERSRRSVGFGVRFRCIDLPTLIRIKEAAGRAKDREAIAELRVLLEEQNK